MTLRKKRLGKSQSASHSQLTFSVLLILRSTVSVDTNVISASLNALIDGVEYALIEHSDSCMLCDDFYS